MKRHWKFAFLILVPLALYAFIAERNSWRPKTITVAPGVWLGDLNFSPDGRYFVVSTPNNSPATTFICEVASRRVVCKLPSTANPTFLSKQCLAVGYYARDEFELPKHPPLPLGLRMVSWPVDFHPIGFLPDGKTIVGNVYREAEDQWDQEQVWDWALDAKRPPRKLLKFETKRGNSICDCYPRSELLRDGRTLLAPMRVAQSRTNFHSEVHLWDIKTKKELPLELDRETRQMGLETQRDSTTDGRLVALDWEGKGVKIWNYQTGGFLRRLSLDKFSQELKGTNPHLVISPDGATLAISASAANAICLWELKTGRFLRHISGVKTAELADNAMKFSPDSRMIFTCHDGIVQIARIK